MIFMGLSKKLRDYTDEELQKEMDLVQFAAYGNYKHDAITVLIVQEFNRRTALLEKTNSDKQYRGSLIISYVSLVIAGLAFIAQIIQMLTGK